MRHFALAFPAFPVVIPTVWHSSHGRCMAFLFIFTRWLWYPLGQTLSTYYAHSQIHSVLSLSKYVVQILASLGFFFCFLAYKFIFRISIFSLFKLLTSWSTTLYPTLFTSVVSPAICSQWFYHRSVTFWMCWGGSFTLWSTTERTQSKWEFVTVCLCSVSLAPDLLTIFPKSCS